MPKIKVQHEGQEIEVEVTSDILPKEVKDDIIKQATGITYGNIDAKLESMGFSKTQGEKTSDFLERVVNDQIQKVRELEEAKPDVSGYTKTIDELKSELKETKTALKAKDVEISSKLLQKEVDSQIKSLVKDITIPSYLETDEEKASFLSTQEQVIRDKFNKEYKPKEVDGKIQFLKGDVIVENSDRDFASVQDIVSQDFKFLFKKAKDGDGGKGGFSGRTKGGGTKTKASSYEEASSLVLKENPSIMAGSAEYYEKLKPILEENGIEN